MPKLTIEGRTVNVGDEFLSMSPAEQEASVNEIASSMGIKAGAAPAAPVDDAAAQEAKYASGEEARPWYTPITSLGTNAYDMAAGLGNAVMHPVDTLNGVANAGEGALMNTSLGKRYNEWALADKPEELARARKNEAMMKGTGTAMVESVNTPTKAWNVVSQHPLDVIGLAAGGAGMAAKAAELGGMARTASLLGKAAELPGQAVGVLGKAAAAPVKGAASLLGDAVGMTSGAGGDAIKTAYAAGRDGGAGGKVFRDAMRGKTDIEDTMNKADAAANMMQKKAGAKFEAGEANLKSNGASVDYNPAHDALTEAADDLSHNGVFTGNPASKKLIGDVQDKIAEFQEAIPNPTAHDLFKLRQSVDSLKPNFMNATPDELNVIGKVRGRLNDAIKKANPDYAKNMEDYSTFKDDIGEVKSALGAGGKASADLKMRKLMVAARQGASSGFNSKANALGSLQDASGFDFGKALAGHMVTNKMPKGLIGSIAGGLSGAGVYSGAIFGPQALALGLASPRLMGETAHLLGRGAGVLGKASSAAGKVASKVARAKTKLYGASLLGRANLSD